MALTPGVGASTPRFDLLGGYYAFGKQGYVASQVLPRLDAPGRQGYFGVVPKAALLALFATKRGPKGKVGRSEWTPSSDNYAIEEFTHEIPVDIQEVDRYGGWFDLYEQAAMFCAEIIERSIEKNCAEAVMNDTTFPASGSTGVTVGTAWSTWATATPLADLQVGFNTIREAHGVEPNAFICPLKRYEDICNTAEFRDRAKYVGVTPVRPPIADFRRVLGSALNDAGLEGDQFKLILPWGRYNSANPSDTVSTAAIWPVNRAMLCRIVDGPDWMSPQLGRQFRRAVEPEIVTYPEGSKLEVVCCTQHLQNKLMSSPPAYMFRGIGS